MCAELARLVDSRCRIRERALLVSSCIWVWIENKGALKNMRLIPNFKASTDGPRNIPPASISVFQVPPHSPSPAHSQSPNPHVPALTGNTCAPFRRSLTAAHPHFPVQHQIVSVPLGLPAQPPRRAAGELRYHVVGAG